jgi:hypothetical protein
MTEADLKNLIQQQLPELIRQDPQIRDFILRTVSDYYAPKPETENRFDQILRELREDRERQDRKWEEQNRKWEEQNRKWEEQDRRWEEQNRKWEEQNRKWDESSQRFEKMQEQIDRHSQQIDQTLAEIQKLHKQYDSAIGALGSRWGLYSEASFRNALKGILEQSFGVQVLNINDYDDAGEVFGRPDQVELDVIIKNGLLIICEIKSSMSKADIYIFDRKVAFYEKRHQRKANRKMIISPMVDERAKPIAEALGIEVYSYADNVKLN